jgi:hypothetical protein
MADAPDPGTARPPKVAADRAAEGLLALVEEQLPREFPPGGTEWPGHAAAFIVRMAELVRSMSVLMGDDRTIDTAILLRVLYEHVVKFCWIAVDSDKRFPIYQSDALIASRKLHNDALPFGITVLDPRELAEATSATEAMPPVDQLAQQVDAFWGGRIDAFRPRVTGDPHGLLTIRGMYIPAYRTLSDAVHGNADVLAAYINAGRALWPVGEGATDRSMWWPFAVALFAMALLVAHEVLGAPDADKVREINNAMYA